MKKFDVRISEDAEIDILNLDNYIVNICNSPLTAKRYFNGIYSEIIKLSFNANAYRISASKSVLQYGHNARRINYKKIAIIYTIHNDIVVIRRVIPGGIISDI